MLYKHPLPEVSLLSISRGWHACLAQMKTRGLTEAKQLPRQRPPSQSVAEAGAKPGGWPQPPLSVTTICFLVSRRMLTRWRCTQNQRHTAPWGCSQCRAFQVACSCSPGHRMGHCPDTITSIHRIAAHGPHCGLKQLTESPSENALSYLRRLGDST